MWDNINEATSALFGLGRVEFVEREKVVIGKIYSDQGFKDPRLLLLLDILQIGLPKGGVLSVHYHHPWVIFIAGVGRDIVSRVELERGIRGTHGLVVPPLSPLPLIDPINREQA